MPSTTHTIHGRRTPATDAPRPGGHWPLPDWLALVAALVALLTQVVDLLKALRALLLP
jgi:hypothetical protein